MDVPHRLKLKIGGHEFEAEGTREAVEAQFQTFTELVKLAGAAAWVAPAAAVVPRHVDTSEPVRTTFTVGPDVDRMLDNIMRPDDRVVSLTVKASTVDDAILLLLYGQKVYRSNDAVTGNEVMQGLAVTGQRVSRVDRVLEKIARDGLVIVVGEHRAKRYRLTNTGLAKARELAAELLATVA